MAVGLLLVVLLVPTIGSAQLSGAADSRAGWLLERSTLDVGTLAVGIYRQQGEVGGTRAPEDEVTTGGGGMSKGIPILCSAVLPGLGEAILGHKRGYLMMAADIALWFGVKHYNDKGQEQQDQYMAYAEEHWSERKLEDAFDPFAEDEYIAGVGQEYYDVNHYTDLSLWVSRADDEREYFENLGKWNQFVFGWDDFTRPEDIPGFTPTGTSRDLSNPKVSANRETYRTMRDEANDQFEKRDTLLYFNLGLRVFSVFQVAYLQGLFGGGSKQELQVAGHPVEIRAQPRGFHAGSLSVAISY
jgi:hypothetical protein